MALIYTSIWCVASICTAVLARHVRPQLLHCWCGSSFLHCHLISHCWTIVIVRYLSFQHMHICILQRSTLYNIVITSIFSSSSLRLHYSLFFSLLMICAQSTWRCSSATCSFGRPVCSPQCSLFTPIRTSSSTCRVCSAPNATNTLIS